MQAPLRLLTVIRLRLPAAILAATAVSTVVFAATPFLIPAVASDYGVAVGWAGLMSTMQLTGFVLASFVGPRVLRPRRRVLVGAALLGAAVNVVAALAPWFAVVLATRLLNGLSLGLIAWLAWAEVFGDEERIGEVAVIGPVVGTVAAPVVALFLDATGPDWLFASFALISLVPLLFVRSMRLEAAARPREPRHRPTRGAVVVLACLGLLTFGGSAVFVYAGAIGTGTIGMSTLAVSLAFSANAVAGIPSARRRGERPWPGAWLAVTALSAVLLTAVHVSAVFVGAMVAWGFAFWMGVPGAFHLLAARSRHPAERAGDAQAVMAVGRVFGPAFGGLLFDADAPARLGVTCGAVMALAAGVLVVVEWRVRPLTSAVAAPG